MSNFGSYTLYICAFSISIFASWSYSKKEKLSSAKKILYFVAIAGQVISLQGQKFDVRTDYLLVI